MDQLLEQLLAEIKLEHFANKDVLFLELLFNLHQLTTVIVMLKQLENVEMDQLQEQLLAEITQDLHAKETVLLELQLHL